MTDQPIAPLTADELAAIAQWHTPIESAQKPGFWFCPSHTATAWPCREARLLATVDAAEQRATYAEEERDLARLGEQAALSLNEPLAEQVRTDRAARERAEQLLCDLTPGGPEYHANPARCFDYVRDLLVSRQERAVCAERLAERNAGERDAWIGVAHRAEAERDEARAEAAALREAIAPIFAYHEESERMRTPGESAGGDVIARVNSADLRRSDLDRLRAALAAALATVDAAEQRATDLERERDEIRERHERWGQSAHNLGDMMIAEWDQRVTEAERERDEARAEAAALREAVAPFVEVCNVLLTLSASVAPTAAIIGVGDARITPDDLARLSAALAGGRPDAGVLAYDQPDAGGEGG